MNTTTTEDPAKLDVVQVHQRWKVLCANMTNMERQVLKLMAHPQATAEQVLVAKNAYSKMLQDMQRTLLALQERYPRKGTLMSPAWGFTSLSGHTYEVHRIPAKEQT